MFGHADRRRPFTDHSRRRRDAKAVTAAAAAAAAVNRAKALDAGTTSAAHRETEGEGVSTG